MQHLRPLPGLRKRGLQPAMGVHLPGKKKFSVVDPRLVLMQIRIRIQVIDDQKLDKIYS
jgi:hypothetical protein